MTIKKCHSLRGSKQTNQGKFLTELQNNYNQQEQSNSKLVEDSTLRLFLEGSGFRRRSTKQLFGDEFKFILNDYPNVCKNAVTESEVRTVKLRIYKVFRQVEDRRPMDQFFCQDCHDRRINYHHRSCAAPQYIWKEYNILEELFETDNSDPEPHQTPLNNAHNINAINVNELDPQSAANNNQ